MPVDDDDDDDMELCGLPDPPTTPAGEMASPSSGISSSFCTTSSRNSRSSSGTTAGGFRAPARCSKRPPLRPITESIPAPPPRQVSTPVLGMATPVPLCDKVAEDLVFIQQPRQAPPSPISVAITAAVSLASVVKLTDVALVAKSHKPVHLASVRRKRPGPPICPLPAATEKPKATREEMEVHFPGNDSHLTVLNPLAVNDDEIEFDTFAEDWRHLANQRLFRIDCNGAQVRLLKDPKEGSSHLYTHNLKETQYSSIMITNHLMGSGQQGTVLKCYHRETRKEYALKKIDLSSFNDELKQEALQKQIQKELSMLFSHANENIVQTYNAFYRSNCLLLLLEFMDYSLEELSERARCIPKDALKLITDTRFPKRLAGRKEQRSSRHTDPKSVVIMMTEEDRKKIASGAPPTLPKFLSQDGTGSDAPPAPPPGAKDKKKKKKKIKIERETPIPERIIAYIAGEVLKGLSFLHSMVYGNKKGVVHKDIKPGNILVNSKGKVKLADFGCCAFVDSNGNLPYTPFNLGTKAYMSPERLLQTSDTCANAGDAKASDIWSVGITVLELACGCHPCQALNNNCDWFEFQASLSIDSMLMPPNDYNMSPEFESFARLCLQRDPSKRPSADKLLQHPFIPKADPDATLAFANWCQAVYDYKRQTEVKMNKEHARKLGVELTQQVGRVGTWARNPFERSQSKPSDADFPGLHEL